MSRGTWQGGGTFKTSGGGGGLVVAVVIVAAAAIGSGTASAAVSALVTIVIVIACLAALAVLGGIALLVYRHRPGRPGAVYSARPVYQLPPGMRQHLEGSDKPAIGPGREIHLHLNVSPDQLAAIVRNHTEGEQ